MTVLGIEIEKDAKALHFIDSTRRNFIFQDFFKGHIKEVDKGERVWCLIWVSVPLGVPFKLLAVGGVLSVAVFAGWTWWLIAPLALVLPELLHTKFYWYARVYLKLRKHGYKGTIRLLGSEELLSLLRDS